MGVQRKLDVALADDAQMPHRLERNRTEFLILIVVECLRWGDDDGVAGVDPHRIEVLHVADGDAVVSAIAHDLVFDLLPAPQVLLHQDLGHGVVERPFQGTVQLILGFDHTAALAAQCEGAAEHDGQADFSRRPASFLDRVAGNAARRRDPDLVESLDEEAAILRIQDHFDRRSEHAYTVLLEDATTMQRQPAVQSGLAAEREQDRVDFLFFNDPFDELGGDRDQVDPIG